MCIRDSAAPGAIKQHRIQCLLQRLYMRSHRPVSYTHLDVYKRQLSLMRAAGLSETPLVVGGIIPEDDAAALRALGVAAVYTPKDFELNRIMLDIVALVDASPLAA